MAPIEAVVIPFPDAAHYSPHDEYELSVFHMFFILGLTRFVSDNPLLGAMPVHSLIAPA